MKVPSFAKASSLSSRLLHVVTCLTYPSVYRDWDDKKTENIHV